jgi:hypothetical protein
MKKLLASLVIIFTVFAIQAQTIPVDQQLIRTTGFTVRAAQKSVIANSVYTGNLAKCIEHQKKAVSLFKEGNKSLAVFHSIYARNLAFEVIKANGMDVNAKYEFTAEEKALENGSPSVEQLNSALPAGITLKDEDYLNPQLTGVDL